MSLIEWRPNGVSIEAEVRIIMTKERHADTSSAACKEWVRNFIKEQVATWHPGRALTWQEAQQVGRAFEERLLKAAKRRLPSHVYTQRGKKF